MKGRTYKYMKEEPLFPFGFGLTYTNFEYKDLQINDDYKTTVTLQNTGETDAEEVVQLYISSPLAGKKDPIYDLKAFKRVFLKAGESKEITFNLSKDSFHQFNENGNKVIRKGTYQLYVNGALPSKRSEDLGSSKAIKTTINF